LNGFSMAKRAQNAHDVRNIYRLIDDPSATARELVRVIDESGEDYPFPARFFVPIEVPRAATKAVSKRSA
jgi:hypothetical protein